MKEYYWNITLLTGFSLLFFTDSQDIDNAIIILYQNGFVNISIVFVFEDLHNGENCCFNIITAVMFL